jgi:hypothetical protein
MMVQGLVAQAHPVIGQLVSRYELTGKTMMSVGSGSAQEEIAFLANGLQRAYLFDLDEHGSLEPALRQLHDPSNFRASIIYTIGNFLNCPLSPTFEPVDLLYFSSFTPDELRRAAISREHRHCNRWRKTPAKKLWRALAHWMSSNRPLPDPDWPQDATPIHPIVLQAAENYMKPGGYLIVQSYCGGVSVPKNPGYARCWRAALARHSLHLLEAYNFVCAPTVSLWVAYKPSPTAEISDLYKLADVLRGRPALTRFHARAQVSDASINKFYDAATGFHASSAC